MAIKKGKALQPNDVDPNVSDKIEDFVMRFKESRIPLFSDEFDQALDNLYKRQTFNIETSSSYPLLKLAAVTTSAVRQVQEPESKGALSFLLSFQRIVRSLVGNTISLPSAPRIDAVDYTEQDIIDTYTLRFAAFVSIVETPVISPKLFETVAQMLSEIPVTSAYLDDQHLPISSAWQSTWSRLPIIPSIIILADACLVSYKRTAASLHACTPGGGMPGRAVGGVRATKRKSSQKKGKGKGKAKALPDTEEGSEASADNSESADEGLFVSEDENDVFSVSEKNKRSRRERVSEPPVSVSSTSSKENLQLRRTAKSRLSAPLKSTASIWDEIGDGNDRARNDDDSTASVLG